MLPAAGIAIRARASGSTRDATTRGRRLTQSTKLTSIARMSRRAVRPTTRFEVFKRDKFTCQYCGKKSPDVVLEIEHVEPVSKGGDNDLMNLVTACEACNDGKGARRLDDDAVVSRQRQQLDRLQEKREQFKMLLDWRHGLRRVDEENLADVAAYWNAQTPGSALNENGLSDLRKWLKKFPLGEVLDAIDIATTQYLERDSDGRVTDASVGVAFQKTPRIIAMRRSDADQPHLKDLFYIRKIVENRCNYFDGDVAIELLKQFHALGADVDALKSIAKRARTWSQWRADMSAYEAELQQTPKPRSVGPVIGAPHAPAKTSAADLPDQEASPAVDADTYLDEVLQSAELLEQARQRLRSHRTRGALITDVEHATRAETERVERAIRDGGDGVLAVLLTLTLLGREEKELGGPHVPRSTEDLSDSPDEAPPEEEDGPMTIADIYGAVEEAQLRIRSEGRTSLETYLLSKGPFAEYLRDGLNRLQELGLEPRDLVF